MDNCVSRVSALRRASTYIERHLRTLAGLILSKGTDLTPDLRFPTAPRDKDFHDPSVESAGRRKVVNESFVGALHLRSVREAP